MQSEAHWRHWRVLVATINHLSFCRFLGVKKNRWTSSWLPSRWSNGGRHLRYRAMISPLPSVGLIHKQFDCRRLDPLPNRLDSMWRACDWATSLSWSCRKLSTVGGWWPVQPLIWSVVTNRSRGHISGDTNHSRWGSFFWSDMRLESSYTSTAARPNLVAYVIFGVNNAHCSRFSANGKRTLKNLVVSYHCFMLEAANHLSSTIVKNR